MGPDPPGDVAFYRITLDTVTQLQMFVMKPYAIATMHMEIP